MLLARHNGNGNIDKLLLNVRQNGGLHEHNDLEDHKLAVRPCHQLDYATYSSVQKGFEQATEIHNNLLRDKQQAVAINGGGDSGSSSTSAAVPTVFRIEQELDQDCFYVAAPLAQVTDEFAMRLPSSLRALVQQSGTKLTVGSSQEDDDRLDFKPSLTKCIIQQRVQLVQGDDDGNDDGVPPVTNVQLEPRTGRRHQLRIHMALVGHAIVSDETCRDQEANSSSGASLSVNTETSKGAAQTEKNKLVHQRMCLHSHKLSVELPGQTKLDLQAPDPFRFDPVTGRVAVDLL